MDSARFDRLAQALGRERSRRGVLGVLAAFVLAPAAAAPQTESCLAIGKPCSAPKAEKALRGEGKGHRHRGHHLRSCRTCCTRKSTVGKDGKARCTCKGEGEKCTNPAQCCGGQCRSGRCTGCPGETVFCDGSCLDVQANDQHCGSCKNACVAGQRCQNGQCVCDGASCANGCCQNETCHVDDDAACGTEGGECAVCTLPETCGGGGSSGQCGCTPATTCPPGLNCGTIPDGCDGDLNCGDCPSDEACGAGGTDNVCGCYANQTVISSDNRDACCGGSCCGELRDGTPLPDGQCMCDTGCG